MLHPLLCLCDSSEKPPRDVCPRVSFASPPCPAMDLPRRLTPTAMKWSSAGAAYPKKERPAENPTHSAAVRLCTPLCLYTDSLKAFTFHLSTFHFPLSPFLFQLSPFHFPLSTFLFHLSSFTFPLSTFTFPLSTFHFHLSTFHFQLSTFNLIGLLLRPRGTPPSVRQCLITCRRNSEPQPPGRCPSSARQSNAE